MARASFSACRLLRLWILCSDASISCKPLLAEAVVVAPRKLAQMGASLPKEAIQGKLVPAPPDGTAPRERLRPPSIGLVRYILDAYCDLVRSATLVNCGALHGYSSGQRILFGQPEQDPLGVLSTTLFFLKKHNIDDMSWKSRQSAAVVLMCFHKLATSCKGVPGRLTVERVVRRFMLPDEEAVAENIEELIENHVQLEAHLVWHSDLLNFYQTSPMAAADERLWDLLDATHITPRATIMLRGIVFYFLGTLLLSEEDVRKELNKFTVYDLGCGVVGLSVVCARRALYDIDHCSDLVGCHREVATMLMGLALRKPHAMEVGAYACKAHTQSLGNVAALSNLHRVAESLGCALPPEEERPSPPLA